MRSSPWWKNFIEARGTEQSVGVSILSVIRELAHNDSDVPWSLIGLDVLCSSKASSKHSDML